MRNDRAYTVLSPGVARLGNRWFERSWSVILGATSEVRQRDADFDWIAKSCPEFRLDVDGESLGVMDLGDVEWTEEYNDFGAALVVRQAGPKLILYIRTLAFHDNPGMLRSLRVMNNGPEPISVTGVSIDVLSIRREGVQVITEGFSCESEGAAWNPTECTAALKAPGRGLILGIEGGGAFELFAPDASVCALRQAEDRVLETNESWTLPDTLILPFTGELEDAVGREYADFLRRVKNLREWEEARKAAISEDT